MKIPMIIRALGAVAVAGGLLASSGCSDTDLVGQTDDTELQDEQTLPFVALGMSREINDLIYASLSEFSELGGLTDGHIAGGSGGFFERQGIGDVRRDQNGAFEQTHEAIWTGYKVVDLAIGIRGVDDARNRPIVARAWLNAGFMERVMADMFCEATYQYGPFGGFNLPNISLWEGGDDEPTIDRSVLVQKDSMYRRTAYAMRQAIDVAEAAIAADIPPPDADPAYFDAESIRMSAYAGLAQAHASLAQLGVDPDANWAAAVAAAAEVNNSHIEFWNTDNNLRNNQNWIDMWTDNEVSIWSGVVDGRQWGAAITQVAQPGDRRVQLLKCQDFRTYAGSEAQVFTNSNVINVNAQACNDPFESGSSRIEVAGVPRWLDERFRERYHDVAAVRGTQMRLIEAEAALFNNNLGLFTQKINEIRSFYGAPPITQPTSVGQMEFPNAMDDAMSLLDAEALLEHWGELRRLAFLHNWQHPFITENHTLLPFYEDLLNQRGAGFQRASCVPLPANECNLNTSLNCPEIG